MARRLASDGKALRVSIGESMGQDKDPTRGCDFFYDHCHLTEKGYDLLCLAVAKVLGPRLKDVTSAPSGDTKQ